MNKLSVVIIGASVFFLSACEVRSIPEEVNAMPVGYNICAFAGGSNPTKFVFERGSVVAFYGTNGTYVEVTDKISGRAIKIVSGDVVVCKLADGTFTIGDRIVSGNEAAIALNGLEL